jgi:hypothetical protein
MMVLVANVVEHWVKHLQKHLVKLGMMNALDVMVVTNFLESTTTL